MRAAYIAVYMLDGREKLSAATYVPPSVCRCPQKSAVMWARTIIRARNMAFWLAIDMTLTIMEVESLLQSASYDS